ECMHFFSLPSLCPNRVERLTSLAQRTGRRFIEMGINLEKRIVRYVSSIDVRVFEVHQRTDRDHFCSRVSNQIDHAADHFARSHDIVDENAPDSLTIQILA